MVRVAFRSAILCLALWGTTASGSRAQPTQLDTCGVAECRDFPFLLGAFVDCPGYDWLWFGGPVGREWWGPLLYTGPIQVSLQIAPFPFPGNVRAPLLLQVRTDADAAECRTAAGTLLWSTYSEGGCPPDSLWETSPLFDLQRWSASAIPAGSRSRAPGMRATGEVLSWPACAFARFPSQ
jgi:hypothetical protein